MRILSLVVGLSLVGCITGEIGPTGGLGDDVGGDDDVGGGSGSGSGSGSDQLTPRIEVTVDRPTIATELGKSEMVTLTVRSIDGFSGEATIGSALLNAQSQPLAGMTATGPTTLTIAADQTQTATFTVAVPTDISGTDFAATLNFDVTSSLGMMPAVATLNVTAAYTVTYAVNSGNAAATHASTGLDITVKRGAKLRFANADTIEHRTHGGGVFPHEAAGGGAPNGTYEVNTIAMQGTGTLGCHTHGDATYGNYTVVP